MEDPLSCSIGKTDGSGSDSNSGPIDMEEHESLPMHSFSNTQNLISFLPQRSVEYDPEELRVATAKFFIICELPFRIVESEAFAQFVADLEPRFTLPSQATLRKDCMNLYKDEKRKLKNLLRGQRICLTIETWTSELTLNYLCITAHFIDCNWEFHKKILKFCQVLDHKGDTITTVLESVLVEWGIDKILITIVDNACSDDVAINYVRREMQEKNRTILGGEFLQMRYASHILNHIVTDSLRDLNELVTSIRDAVRYVISSPEWFAKFMDYADREKINERMVCDVPTRWNSTYLMLSISEKYQKAFELLASEDSQFTNPTCDDWVNTRAFVKLLKIFYNVTLNISGSLYVTANTYFPKFCILEDVLNDMCKSNDPITNVMATNLKIKYDKHWGSINRINLMIYVAFVLDPRYKIMAMTFWLKRCKGDELADRIEAEVRLLLSRLIEEYNTFHGVTYGSSDMTQKRFNATSLNVVDDSSPVSNKFDSILNQFLEEENHMEFKSELDCYLLDGCEARSPNFDILTWWKMNAVGYPILAKIARDVLATPISTVAFKFAYSAEGPILDPFRSSLDPKTVEALICTQSWLRDKLINVRELEEYFEDIYLGADRPPSSSDPSSSTEAFIG